MKYYKKRPSERLCVTIDANDYARLCELAVTEGETIAFIARRLIGRALKNQSLGAPFASGGQWVGIPDRERGRISVVAEEQGTTPSDVILAAIAEYLAAREPK